MSIDTDPGVFLKDRFNTLSEMFKFLFVCQGAFWDFLCSFFQKKNDNISRLGPSPMLVENGTQLGEQVLPPLFEIALRMKTDLNLRKCRSGNTMAQSWCCSFLRPFFACSSTSQDSGNSSTCFLSFKVQCAILSCDKGLLRRYCRNDCVHSNNFDISKMESSIHFHRRLGCLDGGFWPLEKIFWRKTD